MTLESIAKKGGGTPAPLRLLQSITTKAVLILCISSLALYGAAGPAPLSHSSDCTEKDYRVLTKDTIAIRCSEPDISHVSVTTGALFSLGTKAITLLTPTGSPPIIAAHVAASHR